MNNMNNNNNLHTWVHLHWALWLAWIRNGIAENQLLPTSEIKTQMMILSTAKEKNEFVVGLMITTEANEWVSFYFLYLSFWTIFSFRFNCVTFLLVWGCLFNNLIQDQHFKWGDQQKCFVGKCLRWKSGGRDVRDKISYHTWNGNRLCNRTLYHKILSSIYATIVGRKISVWKFFVFNFLRLSLF